MLFSACSSSDAGEETVGATHKQPMLAIYVYAPEQAAIAQKDSEQTRANEGEVDPISTDESTIKSLQLWVYEATSGAYVGYFSTDDVTALNEGQGTTYQIPVSDAFAAAKPYVNVYVMANVTNANCGVGTLNMETTREAEALLNGAIITGHFGLGNLVKSVPDDGLPFAGQLTTQPVVGDAPTLRVGTLNAVSTVQLTRAVSKLRFVFSKATGQPTVSIKSIKMNAGLIPEVEYLFKTPTSMTYNYNTAAAELLSTTISDIAATADPTQYLYTGQEAQAYEDLINDAASKETPEVTVYGPIYLRESDKQLTGTITYTIGGGEDKTVDFAMQQAGDFSRNHTWIVYAYYAGAGKLQVQSLYVKNWSTKEMNYEYFNW
jgi:hypothetical protein